MKRYFDMYWSDTFTFFNSIIGEVLFWSFKNYSYRAILIPKVPRLSCKLKIIPWFFRQSNLFQFWCSTTITLFYYYQIYLDITLPPPRLPAVTAAVAWMAGTIPRRQAPRPHQLPLRRRLTEARCPLPRATTHRPHPRPVTGKFDQVCFVGVKLVIRSILKCSL